MDDPSLEHVWRVAEGHLAIVDDGGAPQPLRTFAVAVIADALGLGAPERTLARFFEVLYHLVDRDDPLVGELLVAMPDADTDAFRGAVTRLGARTAERGNPRLLAIVLSSMLGFHVAVPAAWMRRLIELTPDEAITHDVTYLFYDWATTDPVDDAAREAILSERPALRAAFDELYAAIDEMTRKLEASK